QNTAMERFSDTLSKFSGEIENLVLRDSLQSLEKLTERELQIVDWGNGRIAVPIEVKVDLPSLGNYDDIDIPRRPPARRFPCPCNTVFCRRSQRKAFPRLCG